MTLAAALIAAGPDPAHAEKLMLYGQFVGTWFTETWAFHDDGTSDTTRWEVRFDWVLEGRAVQDVWITPTLAERASGLAGDAPRYGTTLRVYDPGLDIWHIVWADPASGAVLRQVGRQVGAEIVQTSERAAADGSLTRWGFRDIAPGSFTWFNEQSSDGGRRWRLMQEMRARRAPATGAGR